MKLAWIALLIGIAAGTGWCAWQAAHAFHRFSELRHALELVDRGKFQEAWPLLEAARPHLLDPPEFWMARGVCARGLGKVDEALNSWERVPRGSALAVKATAARLALARRSGRYARVLDVDPADLTGSGEDVRTARNDLLFLLRIEGRTRETRRLLLSGLSHSEDPVADLRTLWDLDHDPFPIHAARQTLTEAESNAGDDLGVRLAQAFLALNEDNLDESLKQLEHCRTIAPRSPIVAEARARLAVARGDKTGLCHAAGQLNAATLSAVEWLELNAWMAQQRHDFVAEERALRVILQHNPAHAQALERAAELAATNGRADEAIVLRTHKARRDDAERLYDLMIRRGDATENAPALAEAARDLGRFVEAAAWLRLAVKQQPSDPLRRSVLLELERQIQTGVEPPESAYADFLASCRELTSESQSSPDTQVSIPRFDDTASATGLDHRFDNGDTPSRQLPETMSGGIGLIDFDGDGWLDVYAPQGGRFPPGPAQPFADRLLHNKRDGTFEDATESCGLSRLPGGYTHGVAVADVNNDGHRDLFITRWHSYALYLNKGDGTFTDATAAWQLEGDRGWPTSACFADFDSDGDPDLYVCHYLKWDAQHPRACKDAQERATYCSPEHFPAEVDHLLRNDGDHFSDVSEEAGIAAADVDGRGLGVLAADLDGDSHIDIFVANDTTANYLFRNKGDGTFEECALARGVASNAEGGYLAGMGVACGDVDGDGQIDLGVTNYYGECTTFYRNLGAGQFADATSSIGLASPTRHRLGFGLAFADMNNDGYMDIVQANGHVEAFEHAFPYAMPAQLLLQRGNGQFLDVGSVSGAVWQVPRFGRGLTIGDLDNDGRLDALIVDLRGPTAYLHNRGLSDQRGAAFLSLTVEGIGRNRDAIGTLVTVQCGSKRWVQQRTSGGSYLSSGDTRLHFGLGTAARVDQLTIRWPDASVQSFTDLPVNQHYRVVKGSPPTKVVP